MGRNVIFGNVTMLPDSTLIHPGKSSFQSADLQTQLGNVNPVVNRQRCRGPSRLSVNDNANIFSMGEGSKYKKKLLCADRY